jgi:hypothetical protein
MQEAKEDVSQLELQMADTREAAQRAVAAHGEAKRLYEACKAEIDAQIKKHEETYVSIFHPYVLLNL